VVEDAYVGQVDVAELLLVAVETDMRHHLVVCARQESVVPILQGHLVVAGGDHELQSLYVEFNFDDFGLAFDQFGRQLPPLNRLHSVHN